jgi:hypothetical protein
MGRRTLERSAPIFKRLSAINVQLGTLDHHLGRYLQVA